MLWLSIHGKADDRLSRHTTSELSPLQFESFKAKNCSLFSRWFNFANLVRVWPTHFAGHTCIT